MVFDAIFNSISGGQSTYPCFTEVILTSTFFLHNTLSKPQAAFPHNRCGNNRKWWERNKSCHNDYHQSLERILAKPGMEPTTSCSQVCNTTDWATGLGQNMYHLLRHFSALTGYIIFSVILSHKLSDQLSQVFHQYFGLRAECAKNNCWHLDKVRNTMDTVLPSQKLKLCTLCSGRLVTSFII